jgi:hypothetical protein
VPHNRLAVLANLLVTAAVDAPAFPLIPSSTILSKVAELHGTLD